MPPVSSSKPEGHLRVESASGRTVGHVDKAAAWLQQVRDFELERMAGFLPAAGRVLDFGAGSGHQAVRLQQRGLDVCAVDLESSSHLATKEFPVTTYDGSRLPFPDGYFDAVISSNVLEHVADLPNAMKEIARVLRPEGVGLHVMPSSSWRLWTTLAEFAAAPRNVWRALQSQPQGRWAHLSRSQWVLAWTLRPLAFRPHGTGGLALGELWGFSRRSWLRVLAACGCTVERVLPLRLCYSGEILFGAQIPMERRMRLARWMGSSTVLYVTRYHRARANP